MTDAQAKQIQDIQALLAERRKYEQWIVQLEAKKESTPPHVYTKVHADYEVRLTEAQAKLAAETGVVEKLASQLESTLADQDRLVNTKKDERSEAELRASVGEYTEKEWDKLRAKLDGSIADLSGERDASQRELTSLHALLAEASAPLASAEPEAAPPPPPQAPPAPPPPAPVGKVSDAPALRNTSATTRSSVAAAPPSQAPAGGEKKSDVDDLAFLRSVLGRSTPYTGAGGLPAIPDLPAVPVGELGARKSSAAAPRVTSARGPIRASGAVESFTVPDSPAPKAPSSSPPVREETETRNSSALGAPTPRTSEALRSLKCQECGTLNFPTEWYCERCGGELAAF